MPDYAPVYAYMEADYLDIGTAEAPRVELMQFFTTHNESPKAQTTGKQYVADKTVTTLTTGYETSFPIVLDEFKDDPVGAFIRDVAEEQKLGVACPYYKVRLHQKAAEGSNKFYCRKFTVGFAIENILREGGAIKSIEGSMNALGDVEIGVFDTQSKTFTPAAG